MTLPLERARSRRPITWLTILGVILLPVVIGGVLVAALNNPVDRLGNMRAAIVNDDAPVTVNGQTVPLGRQLAAGLVEGSDTLPSNLDWTISNTDDAAAGIADGTYTAVLTIPENFSAAATSTAPGGTPERAKIQITTAPDARIVDGAITSQVATTASSVLGTQLSQVYLENVLIGFTTLGDQLGEAANGASKLADGGATAADGARQLQDGAGQLASGAGALSDGAGKLAAGLGTIADGTAGAANGAGQLADGLGGIASGDGAKLAAGAAGLGNQTKDAAGQTLQTATQAGGLAKKLAKLASECTGDSQQCTDLAAAAKDAGGLAQSAGAAAVSSGTADAYANGVAGRPGVVPGVTQLVGGLGTVATQTRSLADGLGKLADGTRQSQAGATALQSGASQLQSGASGLADGAGGLADGVAQLGTGAGDLAAGLRTATAALPSYTKTEATDLATVVADPVSASGTDANIFGGSAIPLLAVLALWLGGLASFVALRAIPGHALESRRSSAALAGRTLLPAAAIGALQGGLVAGVVQFAASYSWGDWWLFAALCVIAGIVFAAVHQALVAVLGGVGRWVAAVIGVLFIATGVVSTVPALLTQVAGILPTSPAFTAMLGALTPAGGVGGGVVGMVVWGVLAFAATVLATARRRKTTASALLATA